MTSFVQQTEGVQPTGIGNQQIVQRDNSHINTLAKAVDSTFQAADAIGTVVGKQKAVDIVSEAQQQVDTEQKEAEEFAQLEALGDDASANDIARKTALLEKGVAQGRISRENARLRVADLVTKGIEENPIFASKIRDSASRLLGFNPESEAVRQFFGAFEPAGSGAKPNATEQRAQFLSENTDLSLTSARQLIAQQDMIDLQKNIRQDRLSIGDMTADQALAERSAADSLEGVNNLFGDALALKRDGQEINVDTWRQLATKHENAFVNATLQEYRESRIPVTSEVEAKVRANAKQRYDALVEDIGEFDTGFLTKQNLDRLVTAQKMFGAQAMPTFSLLTNAYGDRTAASLIDLYANAAGNPARLQAILGANPAMSRFVDILNSDPAEFNRMLNNSVLKLADPSSTITENDIPLIDFFADQVLKTANPEERESAIQLLIDKGMPAKATSILGTQGASTATPREKAIMKGEWDLAQGVLPEQIADEINFGNNSDVLTNQGVSIDVTPQGTLTLNKSKPDGSPDPQRFLHPAWNSVQKLNVFLNSADRGWGKDLGIASKIKTAESLRTMIERGTETGEQFSERVMEETADKAKRRVRFEQLLRDRASRFE